MATRCNCPPDSSRGRRAGQLAQAHLRQHLLHPRRVRAAQQQQGQRHVVGHVQVRQHVEGLEHEAQVGAAQVCRLVLAHRGDLAAVEPHLPSLHGVEPRRCR